MNDDIMVGSGARDERAPLEPGRYPAIIEDIEVEPDGQGRGVWLRVTCRLDDGRAWRDRVPTWVAWRVDMLLLAALGDCEPRPLEAVLVMLRGKRVKLELRPSTRGPWLDVRYRSLREQAHAREPEQVQDDGIPF